MDGQDGQVDDADVRRAVDEEFGRDDAVHRLGHHGAGADSVVFGCDVCLGVRWIREEL